MNTNFTGGCLACPPTAKDSQVIYKTLAYTILSFLAICLASYVMHA